jgi:hypothetical protein
MDILLIRKKFLVYLFGLTCSSGLLWILDSSLCRVNPKISCFSAKQAVLSSKDWLGRNQDNVSRVELHVYPLTAV